MSAPPSFLVCCESSGRVREAMRAHGINAWSCDLLPAEDRSPHHIQGDCLDAIESRDWSGFGAHPPCTYTNVAGIHWNDRGRGWERTNAALAFVRKLIERFGDKPFYLEQPVSIISTHWRKPDQVIQPYEFGEDASKKTCLWLQHFAPLRKDPSARFPGRWVMHKGKRVERWSNQTDSGQNRLAPSADRWRERSRTYDGIAQQMGEQWSRYLLI